LADILHVATALHLGADEFLTFDGNQKTLAEAEGLTVKV
jgi:predicted nucleic acid-binding protein